MRAAQPSPPSTRSSNAPSPKPPEAEPRPAFPRSWPRRGCRPHARRSHAQGRNQGRRKGRQGFVKEGLGKAMGDDKMAAEGAAERGEGKFQKALGSLKDAARNALKH